MDADGNLMTSPLCKVKKHYATFSKKENLLTLIIKKIINFLFLLKKSHKNITFLRNRTRSILLSTFFEKSIQEAREKVSSEGEYIFAFTNSK
jgi:hypothetical protein